MYNIHKGDRVYIKPEWQDEGDADHVFLAAEDVSSEDLPHTGVYVVSAQQENMPIQPRYMLKEKHIDSVCAA